MSKMIPRNLIDALRQHHDISIDICGFECDLYIPTNMVDVEPLDAYVETEDYEYIHYMGMVFIEWKPSVYRLKKLGIFVEGESPLIVKVKRTAIDDNGETVDVDVIVGSYIKPPIEYIPDNKVKLATFDLTEMIIPKAHDAAIITSWKATARRYPDQSVREAE